jgi:hypothetical protein
VSIVHSWGSFDSGVATRYALSIRDPNPNYYNGYTEAGYCIVSAVLVENRQLIARLLC